MSVYLRHVHLGFNRGLSHPRHMTGELDVAVRINDVMPHVCAIRKQHEDVLK